MRKTYLFKDDGRRDVYMYVCLFVGKEGKMRFRAAHDQRLAAGPRQGHPVLDPENCDRSFPFGLAVSVRSFDGSEGAVFLD